MSDATQRIAIEIAGRIASSFGSSIEQINSKLGSIGKMAQTAAKIASGAFAAIEVGSFVKESVDLYSDFEQKMADFQVQTGATNAEMSEIEKSSRNLFKNNYGEDMANIADSMAIVKQQTNLFGKELEETTKNALILSDTFDFDVAESTRTAKMMMQQFGYTSEEAYNLIAQGAQTGLNKNDNLLDSINEYSVHFKKLGLDGQDMMNIFSNAAAVGVFDLDKIGDAIKEFSIRAIDGSDSTIGAYEKLGLNADEMAQKFAKGGDVASKALTETLKAIESIDDPVKQDAIGVALFGTMWEDMGKNAVFALDNTQGQLSKTKNTLDEIDNQKYDTLESSLNQLSRTFDDAKLSLIETFGPEISDAIKMLSTDVVPSVCDGLIQFGEILKSPVLDTAEEFIDWISDGSTRLEEFKSFVDNNKTALEIAAAAVGGLSLALLAYNSNAIIAAISTGIEYAQIWLYCAATDAATFATGLFSGALAFLTSPVTLVIAAIAGLVAIGAYLYNNWDELVVKANELIATIKEKFPWMSDIVDSTCAIIGNIATGLKDVFGGIVEFVKGVFSGDWEQAWHGISEIFKGVFEGMLGIATAPLNGIIGMINSAISAVNSLGKAIGVEIPKIPTISVNSSNDTKPVTGGAAINSIPHLATGGIATRSTIAEIGEGSEPEAVTPISKLAEFINGYIQPQQNQAPQVTYSPQIIIQGNATREDVHEALRMSQREFDSMMQKWLFNSKRTALG